MRRLICQGFGNWNRTRSLCYYNCVRQEKIKCLFSGINSSRIASKQTILKVAPLAGYNSIFNRYVSDQNQNKSAEGSQEENVGSQKKKLTSAERLKIITTQYGAFGMAFHITISLISLGMFYFLVYSGVDFKSLFTWFGMETSSVATGASTFVVAYAVHKVFAPLRIMITFVSVPVLVRHFRKIGFFKKK